MAEGGHAWQGGMHGRGCVWRGGPCVAGGACVAGGVHGRGACMAHTPTHPPHWQILRDTVNERAVGILLECILVHVKTNLFFFFSSSSNKPLDMIFQI